MIPHSKPWITVDDLDAVRATLASGMIASGEAVSRFESAISAYTGCPGGVTTPSGTAALELVLRAMGIGAGAGDRVVLPTYVCPNVLEAILAAGAGAVLCDVGEHWVMTPETVAPHVDSRVRAIVAVHTFGVRADLESLASLGVPVIEDCAHALAPWPRESAAASFFSFHATKCLATGEGGFAAVRGVELPRAGGLSDLQASLGLSQLARYREALARRRRIADTYFTRLPTDWTTRLREVSARSIFFRFPIRAEGGFERASAEFLSHGVTVRRGVDALLHRRLGLPDSSFPRAVDLYEHTVSIPIYPALTEDELDRVCSASSPRV